MAKLQFISVSIIDHISYIENFSLLQAFFCHVGSMRHRTQLYFPLVVRDAIFGGGGGKEACTHIVQRIPKGRSKSLSHFGLHDSSCVDLSGITIDITEIVLYGYVPPVAVAYQSIEVIGNLDWHNYSPHPLMNKQRIRKACKLGVTHHRRSFHSASIQLNQKIAFGNVNF